MEYFDVVDINKNKINKILPRGATLKPDEYNVGVEVWIINSNNQLLLTQRSKLKSHSLQWETPGGCLVSGETSEEASIREIKEEIGLDINFNDLNYIKTHLYKYQFIDIYIVKKDIEISELSLQIDEVSDIRWISIKDFLKLNKNGQIVHSVYERYNLIKDRLIEGVK